MARTIRRKHCDWKKYHFVNGWIDDPESLATLTGERTVFGFRLCGKYRGHTVEQIRNALNAKWHGEVPKNWDGNHRKKAFSRWFLRNKNKAELIRALQRGEEDALIPTGRREVAGIWWYYQD